MLASMQSWLELLYDIDLEQQVNDYLITDPALARSLDLSHGARECPEKLLISHSGDTLELALYLDHELVSRSLQAHNGSDCGAGISLEELCLLAEGVSHFTYVAWNATHDRAVTKLELELQGEIDKYFMLCLLVDDMSQRKRLEYLAGWLFDQVSFDHRLSPAEQRRYYLANHYAARYCNYLSRHIQNGRHNRLTRELRSFYRLDQRRKLRHIERIDRADRYASS